MARGIGLGSVLLSSAFHAWPSSEVLLELLLLGFLVGLNTPSITPPQRILIMVSPSHVVA